MDINQYQREAHETALYPGQGTLVGMMYCGLGLTGEAGEVAEHIKKWHRDGTIDPPSVRKELGDTFWYIAELATMFGFKLEDVAQENLNKLASRRERNVLKGSGDHR